MFDRPATLAHPTLANAGWPHIQIDETTMWTLENLSPYEAERSFVRDLDGSECWTCVLAATHDIHPDGTTSVSQEQLPVCIAPEYLGEPGVSSLVRDSDLVLRKHATDVLIYGHAYAPERQPVTEVTVSLAFGTTYKQLLVQGDRTWTNAAAERTSSPLLFERMPLCYERAYGGVDPSSPERWYAANPVGRGFAHSLGDLDGHPAPNISSVSGSWRSVVGFGAIGRNWTPRSNHCGTYDEDWRRTRMPLYPRDFSESFFQTAPADQQVQPPLQGGEPFTLVNMTKSGSLSFCLPVIYPVFRTELGEKHVVHHATIHTVVIEPDYPRVQLIWQTSLPCHTTIHALTRTIVQVDPVKCCTP